MQMAIIYEKLATTMENLKFKLRTQLKQMRAHISPLTRINAAHSLNDTFSSNSGLVLSYASFRDELDTTFLNQTLAKKNLLVLPRVADGTLHLFQVNDLILQTRKSKLGYLEPIPELCQLVTLSDLQVALIPGLAFSLSGYRLGYGGGYYDRLLAFSKAFTIGVGFQTQLIDNLPIQAHDIPLKQVILF